MEKENNTITKLISSCDDGMFMTSEIILEHRPSDGLDGIRLILNLQSGHSPAYLRKGEIKELIDNLQILYDKIPGKESR